jgi:hypothetical protein
MRFWIIVPCEDPRLEMAFTTMGSPALYRSEELARSELKLYIPRPYQDWWTVKQVEVIDGSEEG